MKSMFNLVWKVHWGVWLGLLIVSTSVSVMALRNNNLEMVKLRTAVYAADKSGRGVNEALNNLRAHVYAHMNTDLTTANGVYPPIQLGYTYERLKQQANDDTYHDAQTYCESRQPSGYYGYTRIGCVQSYIQAHPIKTADIPAGLYQFDFSSPTWSPDAAGWSLVASSLLLVMFALKFVASRI